MAYMANKICEECQKRRKRLASTFWGIFCESCLREIRKDLMYGLHEIKMARMREKGDG